MDSLPNFSVMFIHAANLWCFFEVMPGLCRCSRRALLVEEYQEAFFHGGKGWENYGIFHSWHDLTCFVDLCSSSSYSEFLGNKKSPLQLGGGIATRDIWIDIPLWSHHVTGSWTSNRKDGKNDTHPIDTLKESLRNETHQKKHGCGSRWLEFESAYFVTIWFVWSF